MATVIGFLRGKIISKNLETSSCVALAHRVGFEIHVSKRLFDMLEGGAVFPFWIHSHVREDAFTLFGFSSEGEKQLFRTLLTASGLGPKTALSLLSEHGAERLSQLILNKDADALSEAPGVGKKLAQKVILELGSKLEKLAWLRELPKASAGDGHKPAAPSPERQQREDLASALANLGFAPQHVKATLDRLLDSPANSALGFAELLKLALKEMSGRAVPPKPISPSEGLTHG